MQKIILFALSAFTLVGINSHGGEILSWSSKASLPQAALGSGARSIGVTTLNGKIYTVGGLNSPSAIATVLEYDPVADSWSQKANMLSPRYAPAAACQNGKIYAFGGAAGSSTTLTGSTEEYDPLTNVWTSRASMNQVRYAFQAVAVNGKIYAIGGLGPGDVPLSSVEEYDPASDTWSMKTSMPIGRVSFGAVVLNGLIYVVGGRILDDHRPEVFSYNPTLDLWVTNASLPTPRATLGVVVANGQIWAIGGSSPWQPRATIEVYDPVNNVWTARPNLPTVRNECFGAVLGGMLYVFGGYDDWTMQSAKISPVLNLYTAVEFDFATEPGKTYQIEASPDLTTWTNFGVPIVGDGTNWSKLHSTRAAGRLFFRLHEAP